MRAQLILFLTLAAGASGAAQTVRVFMPAGPPTGTRSVWVLGADNKLSRYDTAQFRFWQSMPAPSEARKHPERLSISRRGDVLFALSEKYEPGQRRFWTSNPHAGPELVGGVYEKRPVDNGGYLIVSAAPDVYFSRDTDRLFWFEYREERMNRGPDVWRDATFLSWSTDPAGNEPEPLVKFSFPRCTCETGACEESCPQAAAWAPGNEVSDFFFVTRWVEGQIGSQYMDSAAYRLTAAGWTPRKLASAVERFLDAADHGNVYVEAVPDGGCCGWANDSDDVTVFVQGNSRTVVFDERKRFHNDNYDVSFLTANATVSPGLTRVAYTIGASAQPNEEIRLGIDGKDDPDELRRVKKLLADIPWVEVVGLAEPEKIGASVAKAELVGWLDDARLLVVKDGELRVFEVSTGKLTSTGIKADRAQFVFLR